MGMKYHWSLYMILSISLSFYIVGTHELQSSQIEILLQLRKHLEYPIELQNWENEKENICFISPTTRINVTCEQDFVTELRIMGSKPYKDSNFFGYSIPNQTLSEFFSMDSFVTTLARLTKLRALTLVSLGIWGPLPDKINRLSSLEFLDLSSNYLFGSIPPRISTMVKLRTLRLDNNFFNESIPNWLDSLTNLSILSLSNNQFKGQFPSSITKITTLNTLTLSKNKISGNLPDLSTLKRLKVLDLSMNQFDSNIPDLPQGLIMALLSNNSFNGEIKPQKFRNLNRLQHFDASINHIQGRLPFNLFTLPNIGYLNLASNELSGSFPHNLACGEKLGFVDLSNNRLTGEIPRCIRKITSHFYGNCLTESGVQHQHPLSYCSSMNHKKRNSAVKSALILVGLILGTFIIMGILGYGFLMIWRKYFPKCCQERKSLLQKNVVESSVNGVTSEILANASMFYLNFKSLLFILRCSDFSRCLVGRKTFSSGNHFLWEMIFIGKFRWK